MLRSVFILAMLMPAIALAHVPSEIEFPETDALSMQTVFTQVQRDDNRPMQICQLPEPGTRPVLIPLGNHEPPAGFAGRVACAAQ